VDDVVLSITGLLATVVLLFKFQAPVILAQPFAIGLIAIPLLLQTYVIFLLHGSAPACSACRKYCRARMSDWHVEFLRTSCCSCNRTVWPELMLSLVYLINNTQLFRDSARGVLVKA
jgi:hypothetical protein